MNKAIKTTIIAFLCITIAGASFIGWGISKELNLDKACAFCDPQVLTTHTFYEDSLVMGLCSHKPVQPGHSLAVIRRHIETFEESTDEEISAIGRLLKKINLAVQKIHGPSSYMILQKNGREVGQTVPHFHFHYIPKKKTESRVMPALGLLWSFLTTMFKKPLPKEELTKNVSSMKQRILH